ncbi:DNA-binding protein inhibitor ID-1 [Anolis carolinensis]|uniref:DNA-binding protein inhibitor ID-1 n=1 Tax=Anolis carolinensis TaxID=28377 RepID=UPI000462D6D0
MKVASAASVVSPGPSCALKGVRLGSGEAAPNSNNARCLSEQAAAAASLLMDMKGCYSRLAALVPTLPRHRRVSKVEILQHVIDYIWDLQLELQDEPTTADGEPAGALPEAACVNPDDRILCR